MATYMTYWPGEQLRALKKAGDTGPIKVVLGSIHTRMPSVDSVQVGDIIYPISVIKGDLCVLARLPVEKKESAFDYLIRETGQRHAALISSGVACWEEGIRSEYRYIIHDRVEIPGEPGKYRGVNMFDSPEELPPGYRIVDATREPPPHALHPPGVAARAALRLAQEQAERPAVHRKGRCADHVCGIHPAAQR